MSEERKKPKVYGVPVKVNPYLSVRVHNPTHAVPVPVQPLRGEHDEKEPGVLEVDSYGGRKPPGT